MRINPVIMAIDHGHVAKYDDNKPMDCKKDGEAWWPCKTILTARIEHRRHTGDPREDAA